MTEKHSQYNIPYEPNNMKNTDKFFYVQPIKKIVISSNNCVNNYIPKFIPKDLPWNERDGLMTWYDQFMCEEFLRNFHKHFKTATLINFDIIRREAGEKVPDELPRNYQTVQNERVSTYPKNDQRKFNQCFSY